MSITHIFFDLHGTIIDRQRNPLCYAAGLGKVMSGRYGGTPDIWAAANQRILADWDSYYTDLDLCGDDGIADMWEGIFRTTRAIFRLTGTPEPPHDELLALSRTLPGDATANGGSALYADTAPVLRRLHAAGYALGTASTSISGQVRGSLAAGGILDLFTLPLYGADLSERFCKDERYYRGIAARAHLPPAQCLIVDDDADAVAAARHAGLRALHIWRGEQNSDAVGQGIINTLDALLGSDGKLQPPVNG
ncbi:MAG: HAD hydrolase-like protein [Chloroflexota bacterium]|nr:HAD hydrolase-like protein [Chloroflexota bacterium]